MLLLSYHSPYKIPLTMLSFLYFFSFFFFTFSSTLYTIFIYSFLPYQFSLAVSFYQHSFLYIFFIFQYFSINLPFYILLCLCIFLSTFLSIFLPFLSLYSIIYTDLICNFLLLFFHVILFVYFIPPSNLTSSHLSC